MPENDTTVEVLKACLKECIDHAINQWLVEHRDLLHELLGENYERCTYHIDVMAHHMDIVAQLRER